MPSLSLRIDLDAGGRIGPGKIELLEAIDANGSISAAGRALGMSYRRAWELVDELNASFGTAVTASRTGGRNGGGAVLTPLGRTVVNRFRSAERAAAEAVQAHLDALQAEAATGCASPDGAQRA